MKAYCPKCKRISEVTIKAMDEIFNVKGERIGIESEVAICDDCGNKVFHEDLDSKNLELAYSLYRKKHNLLSPSELSNMRKKYSLSQRSLARLLEWGEITINRYESGSIQDPAHNEVLTFIGDPKNMRELFEKNNQFLSKAVREKLKKRIDELIKENIKPQLLFSLEDYIAYKQSVDEYSGFVNFNSEKIINLILYIAEKTKGIFATKLNKLLWYIDFIHFKEYSISITGSVYKHLPHGPVPDNYKWIIVAAEEKGLEEEEIIYPSGKGGILYVSSAHIDDSYFNKDEKKVVDFALNYFEGYNCKQIREKSHDEKAYVETADGDSISYKYALALSVGLEKK